MLIPIFLVSYLVSSRDFRSRDKPGETVSCLVSSRDFRPRDKTGETVSCLVSARDLRLVTGPTYRALLKSNPTPGLQLKLAPWSLIWGHTKMYRFTRCLVEWYIMVWPQNRGHGTCLSCEIKATLQFLFFPFELYLLCFSFSCAALSGRS